MPSKPNKHFGRAPLEVRYLAPLGEYLDMEFREDTKTGLGRISGVLLRYGDVASIGSFTERFEGGAMKPYAGPIVANILHNRGRLLAAMPGNMTVDFGAREVRAEFDLPDTSDGREAAELVKMGVLAAMSAEFRVDEDAWEGRQRTIKAATLYGLGLVAQPAYPGSTVDRDLPMAASGPGGARHAYRRRMLRGLL